MKKVRFEIYGLIISLMLHGSVFAGVFLVKTGEFSGYYGAINVFIAENEAGNAADNPSKIQAQKKEEQLIRVREPEGVASDNTVPVPDHEVPVNSTPDAKEATRDKLERALNTAGAGIESIAPNEQALNEANDHGIDIITPMTVLENRISDGYYIGDFGKKNGPRFIERTHPSYPLVARRLGREGRVVLTLIIDEEGKLMDVQVIKSAGYGFDHSAVRAIKRSSFTPAVYNGHPIKSKTNLPIRFVLKDK